MNRDPIGERGGLGLYTMTKNNSTSNLDKFGLVTYSDVVVKNSEMFGEDMTEFHGQLVISTHCDSRGDVVLDMLETKTLINNGDTVNNPNATVSTINCGEGNTGLLVSWEGSAEEEDSSTAETTAALGGGVGGVVGGVAGGNGGALAGGLPAVPGAILGAAAGGSAGTAAGAALGGIGEGIFDDEWKISWKVQFKICCACFEGEWFVPDGEDSAAPSTEFKTNNDDFYLPIK